MAGSVRTRVVIDQKAVGNFVRTDLALQEAMDKAATELQKRVEAATPIGKGLPEPRYGSPVATTPGHARSAVQKVTYRWWRRVRSMDIAGHIAEFGSPPGTDSIGRHHFRTPAYRPFIKSALSSRDLGRFVPRSKGSTKGDSDD